jgi:16S rRNA (adenine1518-N6/adenine1519-N6)-dimethyltransferase
LSAKPSSSVAVEKARWAPRFALARVGVRPSKGKGQKFLVQPAIADRIVAAAGLSLADTVIEIGPGLGILSERIAAHRVRRLYLIELDKQLAAGLRARFASVPNVEITQSDFLDLDPASIFHAPQKIIGSLPFNAAAAILRRLCDWRHEGRQMSCRMVLMFQREVAERIRARPGQPAYSMLSAITALYWEIDAHFRVAPGSFYPKPKVDAEVLCFAPRAEFPFAPAEEAEVLSTIRAAFSARRKTIRNALHGALDLTPAVVDDALARAAIRPGVRAESLDSADFVRLSRALPPGLHRDA